MAFIVMSEPAVDFYAPNVQFKYKPTLKLRREYPVYKEGESVGGTLSFNEQRPFKFYDLQIRLIGRIGYLWYVKPGDTSPASRRYGNRYFNETFVTKNLTEPGEPIAVNPNTDVEFEIELPSKMWSTYMGTSSYRMYSLWLYARPNIPQVDIESFIMQEIVIVSDVDPNMLEMYFEKPLTVAEVHTSPKGKVVLEASVARTWTVPGEIFNFCVRVDNGIRLPLANIQMILRQNAFVHTDICSTRGVKKHQSKNQGKIIFTKDGESIPPGPGRKVCWRGSFKMPHEMPSDLENVIDTKYIKISYSLEFVLAKFVNLKITIPIKVGSVPTSDGDWETASLAYGQEFSRTMSLFSLDSLDTFSLASGSSSGSELSHSMGNCSITDGQSGSSRLSRTSLPPYDPKWKYPSDTPPPNYG